jgi:glycosyltransferase involved in cell wall biosynthesis
MTGNRKAGGKIVLLKGISTYNVLRLACDLMARGFEENGYQTVIIDAPTYSNNALLEKIYNEMRDNGLFVFSFNAIYHDLLLENNNTMYNEFGCPTIGFLVDHPYYQKSRVEASQNENIYLGCIDPDHVAYIHNYYPKFKHVSFLPHFSFQAEELIPYEKRKLEIFYPGSYTNPERYQSNFAKLPQVFRNIATEVFERISTETELTLEEALRRYLAFIKFEYSAEDFIEIVNQIYFVDHLVRDYRRDRIVRTILDAGIGLTVSGAGWDEMELIYKDKLHIIGKDGLDIEENIQWIADTKILFNTFPNFKNGTHERIFTGMRNGCVCLTDPSGYLLEKFENNKDLVYYNIKKIEELPEIIRKLLNEPERAMQISENAYQKTCMEYNEKNTAKKVLDFMGFE